jgi:hypothetical protein
MPVYVIYSGLSLGAIREFLLSYGSENKVGHLRVIYNRDGRETDITIATLDKSLYDTLIGAGFDKLKAGIDFTISPYRLIQYNRPSETQTSNFYIPLPKPITLTESQVYSHIVDRLKKLVDFGDLSSRSFRITIPKVSRDTGELKGNCFVSFKKEVPIETIALCRSVLDGSTWVGGKECRCLWSQQRPKKEVEATTNE